MVLKHSSGGKLITIEEIMFSMELTVINETLKNKHEPVLAHYGSSALMFSTEILLLKLLSDYTVLTTNVFVPGVM